MNNEIIWLITGMLAFIILVSIITQLRSEIAQVNVTLNKIAKHIGLPELAAENIDAELKSLISKNEKIKAIKRYRTVTGLGLKEAKEYVDLLSVSEKIELLAGTEIVDPELKTLIVKGEKIKAIKRYRTLTGLSLKEAKEYIDLLC